MGGDPWGPIRVEDWRDTPVLAGRCATEDDIRAGIAVFCIPTGSIPHPVALPACALHHDIESGATTPVIVIQAEHDGSEVVVGARPLDGGNLVCLLDELELLDGPDARFFD